tara:strand:- start:27 stop:1358 length:1332 start_codon:yes stop_codon:yes gene_type:complete
MASTYLTFTQQTPSTAEAQKFTLSMWVKKCGQGTEQGLYGNTYSNTHRGYIYFDSADRLAFFDSSGTNIKLSRKFRDANSWYHIVFAVDTTQSSDADKIKIYINGELYAGSYSSNTYPNNNQDLKIMNTTNTPYMGRYVEAGTSYYFQGALSHVHFTQGYVYQASDFGETDATTGEWKIKTSPSISNYGTNGFWWLKDSIATTDHSPNSNSFSVGGGTLTKTEDCPSNVFCTMNPLDNQNQGSTFTIANNKIEWNTNNKTNFATFAVNKGKWYWEMKFADNTGGNDAMTGVCREVSRDGSDWVGHDSHGWSYYASQGNKYHGGSGSSYGNSWTTNDIIGVAFDADTRTLWFSKNGTWQNSATISEIAAGTTTNSAFTNFGTAGEFFFPATSGYDGNKIEYNFGNGYFSTTAVASAGSNASNLGIFEYDVPNNFTALCTKGLNE